MVKIPTYDSQIQKRTSTGQGAQGFSGGQIAVASDTGLEALGKGVRNLASNLKTIEVNRQKKEATLWTSNSYEKVYKEYSEWENQEEIDYKETGAKGHTENALKKFQEISDKYLANAPNQYAKQEWKLKMNQFKMQVFKNSTAFEAAETLEHQKDQLNETIESMAIRAAENPEAWKVGQLQSTVEQIINGLADNKDTENIEGYNNIWSKSKLKNSKEQALSYIAETMIQSVIDEGDTGKINQIKGMFEKGRFKQVLTAEKHQALRNKLFGLSGAINKAERKKFEIKLDDNLASIGEDGVITHKVTKEEFDHWYGKNNAQWVTYQRQFKKFEQVYIGTSAMATMTPNGMAEYIDTLPTKTADDKEVKILVQEHAQKMIKLMDDDPIQFASRYRKDIFNKIQSDDNATKQQGLFELEQMQIGFGKQPSEIMFLGDTERQRLVTYFSDPANSDAQQVGFFVQELKKEYGDYFDDVMAELVLSGKLDPTLSAAMMYADDEDFGLLYQSARTPKDTSNLKENVVKDINIGMQAKFEEIRKALTETNPEAIPMLDGWQNLIEKRALILAEKMDADSAVDQAYQQFISDKFHVGDDFLVPKRIKDGNKIIPLDSYGINQFQEVLNNYVVGISNSEEAVLEVLLAGDVNLDAAGTNDGSYQSIQRKVLQTNTRWRMTSDGKGVELVWNFQEKGHYPVYIMDNGKRRKIVFDYLKLAEKIDEQGIEKTEPEKPLTFGEVLMQID